MSNRTAAALGVWRARAARTPGDQAFLGYMVLLIALVAVVPVARAVWLSAIGAAGVSLFSAPSAPMLSGLAVATLWTAALVLGRERGPALLPPFLTHALASSDLPRSGAFRGTVVRAGLVMTGTTTIVAGVAGGSLLHHGFTDPLGFVIFVAVGAVTGIIATAAWLAGQAVPRATIPVVASLCAAGALSAALPWVRPFTPWGWVELCYPASDSPHALTAVLALTALAALFAAAAPTLMSRLDLAEMTTQAVRWDSATRNATNMEFGAAAAAYRGRPHLGRSIRAVRTTQPLPLSMTFLVRDAIGAARTPGRLIVGVVTLAAAGVLVALAFAPAAPGWVLGAAAGLLIFAGLGPLTDGVRHAASVASDLPLFGISDERLLANHAVFPLTTTILVLGAAVFVSAAAVGIPAPSPLIATLALGVLTLIARISSALKGPMPPVLLTPIPTEMGDLGAVVRLTWAIDGVLTAAFVGASVTLALDSPAFLTAVSVLLIGGSVARWRQRFK